MYRWIQITAEESKKRVQQGLVTRNSGYRYKNSHGVDMVEYHVGSSKLFQDDADKEAWFSGRLSVHIEMDTSLIIFGHDESMCFGRGASLTLITSANIQLMGRRINSASTNLTQV
jgi:hypothetical protein